MTGIEVKTTFPPQLVNIRITESGLDFLEDDGGIGAILRTVTVKLDAEQLRQILTAKIATLSIPEPRKASAIDAIRKLPAEVLNKLVMKTVEKGIEHVPDLLEFLRNISSTSPGGPPPGMIV